MTCNEENAVHEITEEENNKRVKLITAYLVTTTQRQEQTPTKYNANSGYLNTVPNPRQRESLDSN